MKTVKKTAEYTIFKRNDGRYAVKNSSNKFVNGEEKVKILLAEELIKVSVAAEQPVEEEAAVEEGAEESSEESSKESAEEASADEADAE